MQAHEMKAEVHQQNKDIGGLVRWGSGRRRESQGSEAGDAYRRVPHSLLQCSVFFRDRVVSNREVSKFIHRLT